MLQIHSSLVHVYFVYVCVCLFECVLNILEIVSNVNKLQCYQLRAMSNSWKCVHTAHKVDCVQNSAYIELHTYYSKFQIIMMISAAAAAALIF